MICVSFSSTFESPTRCVLSRFIGISDFLILMSSWRRWDNDRPQISIDCYEKWLGKDWQSSFPVVNSTIYHCLCNSDFLSLHTDRLHWFDWFVSLSSSFVERSVERLQDGMRFPLPFLSVFFRPCYPNEWIWDFDERVNTQVNFSRYTTHERENPQDKERQRPLSNGRESSRFDEAHFHLTQELPKETNTNGCRN